MIYDEHGDYIKAGEKYLAINYLNLENDWGKKQVKYERTRNNKDVFIHLTEIFATNLVLNEDLKMEISEYRSLVLAAL